MFNKDKKLTLNANLYSPHSIIPKLINKKTTILDVGCNTGYIGKYLIDTKDCIVSGIDVDKLLLDEAKQNRYKQTFQIDLYSNKFIFPREKYDYILFIDILEHLPNPAKILQRFVDDNLEENGSVIICLPNIGRIECRLKHLLGKFDYEESGIIHQDHLRFFTRKSAMKMIEECGLRINKIIPTGLGAMIGCFLNLTAFQFIFVCQKK